MATQAQIKEFIQKIAPYVQAKCKEHGWGIPSAIIAQAGLESAWGTSGLSTTCNNFWGMKYKDGCGTDYKTYYTKEQKTTGEYYTVQARFRRYPDMVSGVEGYFKFIESYPRYRPVMMAVSYKSYCVQIKACGWATSLSYSTNLINTVEKYGLTMYDSNELISPVINDIPGEDFKVNTIYTTQVDLNVRSSPNGSKLKYDALTVNAKLHSKYDEFGNAILKQGTRVTCQNVKSTGTATWIKIPSGWICGKSKDKVYVK